MKTAYVVSSLVCAIVFIENVGSKTLPVNTTTETSVEPKLIHVESCDKKTPDEPKSTKPERSETSEESKTYKSLDSKNGCGNKIPFEEEGQVFRRKRATEDNATDVTETTTQVYQPKGSIQEVTFDPELNDGDHCGRGKSRKSSSNNSQGSEKSRSSEKIESDESVTGSGDVEIGELELH